METNKQKQIEVTIIITADIELKVSNKKERKKALYDKGINSTR